MDSLKKEEKDQNMKLIAIIPPDIAKSPGATVFAILNPGFGRNIQRGFKEARRAICPLRNHLIAEILYKSKEIERWGSGLKRIYEECKAAACICMHHEKRN